MSFDVFEARNRAKDLADAVNESVFYNCLRRIVEKDAWKSYVDEVNFETVTFASLDEFLLRKDGLNIEVGLKVFQECVESVSRSNARVAPLAEAALDQLIDAGMTDLRGVKGVAAQAQPLAIQGEIGNGRSRVANGHSKPVSQQSSNSQERILRRLARDRPDLLEMMKTGEFSSARQAGIAAGFVKDVPSVRLTSPEAVAAAIRKRWSPEQVQALCAALR